jgi:hypothetical protein
MNRPILSTNPAAHADDAASGVRATAATTFAAALAAIALTCAGGNGDAAAPGAEIVSAPPTSTPTPLCATEAVRWDAPSPATSTGDGLRSPQ